MLEVTNNAAKELKTALLNCRATENDRFRVLVKENCLQMMRDEERPGDVTVEHEGEVLLVMDPATADRLSGHKIEYDEAVSRLVLT